MGRVTHGHSRHGLKTRRSPTWIVWRGMIGRCYTPGNASYARYGGRGITVCDRWRVFENFLADMGERPADPPGHRGKRSLYTLDRIDSKGHYEPGNCRWVTWTEQAANRQPTSVCPKGHAKAPENVMVDSQGTRLCRVCYVLNYQRSNERKRLRRAAAA